MLYQSCLLSEIVLMRATLEIRTRPSTQSWESARGDPVVEEIEVWESKALFVVSQKEAMPRGLPGSEPEPGLFFSLLFTLWFPNSWGGLSGMEESHPSLVSASCHCPSGCLFIGEDHLARRSPSPKFLLHVPGVSETGNHVWSRWHQPTCDLRCL